MIHSAAMFMFPLERKGSYLMDDSSWEEWQKSFKGRFREILVENNVKVRKVPWGYKLFV